MKKIFHIVGAGRVGQTFATLLSRHPEWQLSHIVSRSLPSNAFGATVLADMANLPPADVVIIATPDNAIEATAERLACEVELTPQTVVLHLSGAKTIQVLQAVTTHDALAGSLHPVFAFADVEHSVANLAGNLCAIEAEQAQAVEILQQLAEALGLTAFALPSEYKARYHAALSAASNFSVTLAAFAQDLLTPLALQETLSRRLVGNLMQQSINNLGKLPPLQALTGPIVRGDDSTVAAHLAAMTPEEQAAYRVWAQATLNLAAARLDKQSVEKVQTALHSGSESI
ncbi:DUF2520 domain-containing protein [Neisseria brasiliensis]|uniref:Rossmann-like and DUF2520 domain-containing protein n=1 Tax=Neisseria TaxID=482 RepID=UPI000C27A86C|nr:MULTISPECIES: Rossmann-like and DUF2520 domain-containing protein [Neisseria]PJO78965.1 DUF2520 domain-containing protein [Neisseria sp. N177_16]QGL24917.1 DUF2520 domain-containing protein [Neisseria brasiliensis]